MASRNSFISSFDPGSKSKRSVRRVWIRTGWFIVVFILIFGLLSTHYAMLVQNDQAAYLRIIDRFSESSPLVVILGDSHPLNAVDMQEIDETYALLAHGGDNLRQMVIKLDYAVSCKQSIKYAVIPLDYHSLAVYRERAGDFSRDLYYSSNYQLITSLYGTNYLNVIFHKLSLHVPLLDASNWERYYLILTAKMENKALAASEAVTPENWSLLNDQKRNIDTIARLKGQLEPPIVSDEMVRALEFMISYCKNNKIALIGVRYPVTAEYLELAGAFGIEQVNDIYLEKAEVFLAILDYREIFAESPGYFANTDHLSAEGAKVFTNILQKDLGSLLESGVESLK